jgi:hypothetical protein
MQVFKIESLALYMLISDEKWIAMISNALRHAVSPETLNSIYLTPNAILNSTASF